MKRMVLAVMAAALALSAGGAAEGRPHHGRWVCTDGHCGQVRHWGGVRRKHSGKPAEPEPEKTGGIARYDRALERGIELDSFQSDWSNHFLLAEGAAAPDRAAAEWKAKVESRDALLAADPREDRTGRWRQAYEEALEWRLPRNGDLASALEVFRAKAQWTEKAFLHPDWMHDLELLEKASLALREMGEWSLAREAPGKCFRERQQELLEKAGARSPGELPDAASRQAYSELMAREGRVAELAQFQDGLQPWSKRMAEELLWHCKWAKAEAEEKGDEEALRRLAVLQKRILGSVAPEARFRLRYQGRSWPDIPAGHAGGAGDGER